MACLNGSRRASEHPRLPTRPDELATDAASVVRSGAEALHIHPKDLQGVDTLAAAHFDAAVLAVTTAVPSVPVGVTTGAWTARDPADRRRHIDSWTQLPHFASLNWHEEGSLLVGHTLNDRGIPVEAGLWDLESARRFVEEVNGLEVLRVLLEPLDGALDDALRSIHRMIEVVEPLGHPILVHGSGPTAWGVLREALALGFDTRIGLEDTLRLPSGRQAQGNGELMRTAVGIASGSARRW